jgi:hypothetical protein
VNTFTAVPLNGGIVVFATCYVRTREKKFIRAQEEDNFKIIEFLLALQDRS